MKCEFNEVKKYPHECMESECNLYEKTMSLCRLMKVPHSGRDSFTARENLLMFIYCVYKSIDINTINKTQTMPSQILYLAEKEYRENVSFVFIFNMNTELSRAALM